MAPPASWSAVNTPDNGDAILLALFSAKGDYINKFESLKGKSVADLSGKDKGLLRPISSRIMAKMDSFLTKGDQAEIAQFAKGHAAMGIKAEQFNVMKQVMGDFLKNIGQGGDAAAYGALLDQIIGAQ